MTENKDLKCSMDLRIKSEDDRRGVKPRVKSENDRKEEQGRSMVEMLGVLAIVGVLSVGGIAGYTYAMNKYYANELLAGASERAVLVTAQIVAGRTPNLNEFAHYPNVGGTFGQAKELEDGSGFIIPVSGVKGAVCENLIQATEGTDIVIADTEGNQLSTENCDDDNLNDLAFVFETGMSAEEGKKGCTLGSGKCVNGSYYSCEEDEEGNNFWAQWEEGDFPSGYTCDGDTLTCDPGCEDGEKCINGTCVPFVSDCSENIEIRWDDENGERQTFDPVLECTQWCEKDSINDELNCYEAPEDMVACSDNSDCNDWCRDKDEPCFCNFASLENENSGSSAVVGGCAVATQGAEDSCIMGICSEEAMIWLSAKNFCQAHGLGIWHVSAGVSEGAIVDSDLKELANDYYDRWFVWNDGEPSRIDGGPYIETIGATNRNGKAVCD